MRGWLAQLTKPLAHQRKTTRESGFREH